MKISDKINKVNITTTDIKLMVAAFVAYTGMYAVRKSFLAGQYADAEFLDGYHFKTILVISQIIGYMLSKFIGIRMVAEVSEKRRGLFLAVLVGFGLVMLLLFAVLPTGLKPIALFLNGMPLGMVFGLVLSYLEGRKNSELLVAGLSATFIFSTGFVKTTAIWLKDAFEISEYFMPFATGLLFFPLFLWSIYGLKNSKAPTQEDIEQRTKRVPMKKSDRKDFLRKHGFVFIVLVVIYVVLTIIRDFRDNFMVEFWGELGMGNSPELLTYSETPIAIGVLIFAAFGILIKSNKSALSLGLYSTIVCAVLLLLTTYLFQNDMCSPMFWMVTSGSAVYIPYILFHCLLFERLMAYLKYTGTVSYLFYVADAFGYLFSVIILLIREFMPMNLSWIEFFGKLNIGGSILIFMLCLFAFGVLKRKNARVIATA